MPLGRYLKESDRHFTLAFLGSVNAEKLSQTLSEFPRPPFLVGRAGYFTKPLFLPFRHPNVVAWDAAWLDRESPIITFQKQLSRWLIEKKFLPQQEELRDWLPHVTLCRKPFDQKKWSEAFQPLPFITGNIHLYESLGHSNYAKLWSYPLTPAFEEIEHTADIAFRIFGENIEELYRHAFTALAFKSPLFLPFFKPKDVLESVDDIVMGLNESIAYADQDHRCPFKAVSFHGDIQQNETILQWDMIVDV